MIKVKFYNIKEIDKYKQKYVVIMAKYEDKWILVRHKDRSTWEIPGGHIEKNETIENAAKRELYEETGAKEFNLNPVSIYSVTRENIETFGFLYYGEVFCLDSLPNSEIEEIKLVDDLDEDLTYPLIQPLLAEKVMKYLNNKTRNY